MINAIIIIGFLLGFFGFRQIIVYQMKYNVAHYFEPVPGKQGLYFLYPLEKVGIPSYQWRKIPFFVTGPFDGAIDIGKYTVFLFGKICFRVLPINDIEMNGMHIVSNSFHDTDPKATYSVVAHNFNPKYPFVAHTDQPFAYIEFYRIPFFITKTRETEVL